MRKSYTESTTLIDELVNQLTPVKRVTPPIINALVLVSLAVVVIAALARLEGLREDWADRVHEMPFLVSLGATALTGVMATLAAFNLSLPDRSRWWMVAPLPTAILWVAGIGYGCLANWLFADSLGFPPEAKALECIGTLIGASFPLAVAVWLLVRPAKPLRYGPTAWLAALAVAAFADTAHLLFQVVNDTPFVLIMNFGVTGLIMVGLARVGQRSLRFVYH